jgi:hypothetical protein
LGDIAARNLLVTRADGAGPIMTIEAAAGVSGSGFGIPIGWQPTRADPTHRRNPCGPVPPADWHLTSERPRGPTDPG